jgi:hypothetical protein
MCTPVRQFMTYLRCEQSHTPGIANKEPNIILLINTVKLKGI